MRYNILLHGSALDAANELDGEDADNSQLRAALTNALTRISRLEARVGTLSDEVDALRRQVPDNR